MSPYAIRYDAESSVNWSADPELNRMVLRAQENFLNDMLNNRGHVFLNEVYDALGCDRTAAGAVIGWALESLGDGRIEFETQDLGGGVFRVDFNVDGVIIDKLKPRRKR